MIPIVILVHGMGTHRMGNITSEFVTSINETARCLLALDDFDIQQLNLVDLVEFNYSDEFDQIRMKIASNADAIKKDGASALQGKGIDQKIIDTLLGFDSSLKGDSMFATHWLDVILYGSTFYGEKIRVEFAKLLNEQIKRAMGREIHIICHSLGTAVVHDTMAKLYRRDPDITSKIPGLIQGAFNVNSLWTFANVSRLLNLLNGLEDPMDSPVTTGSNGCTDAFYNIRHKLDPFTWFKTFNRYMPASLTIETEIVRKWNTHSFAEYIGDPLVTQKLLSTLTTRTAQNSPDRLAACIEKRRKNTINAAVDELTQAKSKFSGDPINSFKDAFKAINDVMDAVKELKKDFENDNANQAQGGQP